MVSLDTLNVTIPAEGTAVALGYFDGLHMGHMEVIRRVLECRKNGLAPCVFTFTIHNGHPENKTEGSLLMTEQQRIKRLEALGVEYVVCPDFEDFKELTPEQFVELLAVNFHAKVLCCGTDFRFGKGAAADAKKLKQLCEKYNITVNVVEKITWQSEEISSTRIRHAIKDGEVSDAEYMMGEPYQICSEVIEGKRLGRNLGFPTANQLIPADMTVPKAGVYATEVVIDDNNYAGVTNIGKQPTVGGESFVCESYIIDFSGNLYGKTICIKLKDFIRPVVKFGSVQELTEQIGKDALKAKILLQK